MNQAFAVVAAIDWRANSRSACTEVKLAAAASCP
jgi:hypothetical protein